MGLFHLKHKAFESNTEVANAAAQERWGDQANIEPVAANVGAVALKVEVQDQDPPNPYMVEVDQHLDAVAEDFHNQADNDSRAAATSEELAIADFVSETTEPH